MVEQSETKPIETSEVGVMGADNMSSDEHKFLEHKERGIKGT